jgi:hypothetical protein
MTLGDLSGQIDWLHIVCDKCDRHGCYSIRGLAKVHGRNFKILNWVKHMTFNCPRRLAPGLADPCGARCPELTEVT